MKRIKTVFTLILLLMVFIANAQITKSLADNIVTNIIMNDTTKVVYGMNNILTRPQSIFTADGIEIKNPYDNSYVYYIDDTPKANWAHPCRYCFVNVSNGVYYIENQMFYPENHEAFSVMGKNRDGYSFQWPYTNYTIPAKATPNEKLYAVLIGGPPGYHYYLKTWYNLSCIYTALVNKYGFQERTATEPNHIIATAFGSIMEFIDHNDLTNNLYDLNQSGGVYDSYDFLEDIEYSKTGIYEIFSNLAGTMNTSDQVPELTAEDKLFIILCGHGNKVNGNSYFRVGSPDIRLYDYELTEWVRNIKCSQMVFLIDCCYSGGFIDDLMNDPLALCKNRSVHTATDDSHYGWVEQHITRRNRDIDIWHRVDEYVYYWTAASLGYYPMLEVRADSLLGPWHQYDNTTIGQFPWNLFSTFHEGDGYTHNGYDVNPDRNADGTVSLEEAFIFANNLDTYSPQGYFNPYSGNTSDVEYPQSSYESTFTKELITLDGYKGHVSNDVQTGTGHSYIIDGNVTVGQGKSITINNGTVINGNGYSFTNWGRFTTTANITSATFNSVGIVNTDSDILDLSNCIFNNCGTIISYDSPFSITNSIFNETSLEINTNNPGRDIYNIDIIGNQFNNTTNSNSIYLRKQQQCIISGNNITSGGNGIYSYRLTNTYSNNRIFNNNIHNCGGSGIVAYNSNLKLEGNTITANNQGGLKSLNLSNVYVRGDSTATIMSATQSFTNNGQYQIFASIGSAPVDFHYNVLRGKGTSNDTILYFESYTSSPNGRNTFNAKYNCWYPLTSSQVPSHLYTDGNDTYIYLPIWNLDITPPGHDEPGRLLAIGDSLATNGDYDGAIVIYTNIISFYPNTEEAVVSLKALFAIETESYRNFDELKTYYLELISNDNLADVADKLANRCDVEMKNYTDAIAWYEDKLTDPNTSLSDHIFAEIDLGDVYIDMDADDTKGIMGTMTEYIPASKELHEKNVDYLLSLLPGTHKYQTQEEECHLADNSNDMQPFCYPNPINDKLMVSFALTNDADVEISVFNMFGNVVRRFDLGLQKSGTHEMGFDISDLMEGIYCCGIKYDNNVQEMVKIIIKH